MRHMPTLEMYLHEMHARKMHAREVHAHEMHAREMHAREEQINHKRPHMGGRFVESRSKVAEMVDKVLGFCELFDPHFFHNAGPTMDERKNFSILRTLIDE